VIEAVERFYSVPYRHSAIPSPRGVKLSFFDAGHVLGSAVTVLDVGGGREDTERIVFTGDLGPRTIAPSSATRRCPRRWIS
jgi:metallo-beta-lactamase family protein